MRSRQSRGDKRSAPKAGAQPRCVSEPTSGIVTRFIRLLPWIWVAVVGLWTIAILAIPESGLEATDIWSYLPLLFSVMAAVVFARSPGNAVAWLLLTVGFGLTLFGTTSLADGQELPVDPSAWETFDLVYSSMFHYLTLMFPLLLLLHIFPSGQVLNRRWRWAWWVFWVAVVDILVFGVFAETIEGQANPVGVPGVGGLDRGPGAVIIGLAFTSLLVGGVVSIVLRYRRSSMDVQSQIKWVLLALAVFAIVLGLNFLPFNLAETSLYSWAFPLSIAFIPVSIALAVTSYRLYDVDRFISRTIGYALVVALLAIVYLVGAVWLPTRLLGEQPPLFVAGSTLAVAALFTPLRRRVLEWVDRRFYRSSYNAELVVEGLADRMRNETDVEVIVSDAVDVAVETMQPETVGVWVRD